VVFYLRCYVIGGYVGGLGLRGREEKSGWVLSIGVERRKQCH